MTSLRLRNDLQVDPPTALSHKLQQMEMGMVPESPLIDRMPSPDHRTLDMGQGNGSGSTPYLSTPNTYTEGKVPDHLSIPRSGLTRTNSYRPNNRPEPQPQFLLDPSPSSILALLEAQHTNTTDNGSRTDTDDDLQLRTKLILRHALRWAVERGDGELIAWLVGLEGQWADVLDNEVHSLEDEEGWGLVGISIQCSCGRQDKEEGVRAIVGRWGLQVGARGGRDRTGWTPLHLAALLSTPPLISFLLSRGASPHALTNRGLTPLDLVMGMPDREDVALFLEHATANGQPSSSSSSSAAAPPALTPARQKMLDRRRRRATRHLNQIQADEKRDRVEAEREAWLRESARVVDVDPELLISPPRKKRESRGSDDSGLGWMGYELDLEAERDCDSESEMGMDDEEIDQLDLDSDMLVFSLSHLSSIFDILISDYTPQCQPLPRRTLPANTLFLYARFALYRCDESWLEELIEGAVVRIEQNIYSNTENLAYLAFWAYNTTVLLHLLKSDPGLNAACDELGLLNMIEELINAIHVFVIRVAERRIDTVLDAAILDYETLEDFNDVRFEGEWSLFRSLAPKKKRDLPKAANIFVNGSPGDVPPSPGSPFRTPIRPHQSMSDLRLAASGRSLSNESNISAASGHSHASSSAPAPAIIERALSPKSITDILSGVLLILQLYEVNPAIVVQAFSQIFFWISCELFNRILTRKKYLCRTKAMQIRMNVTILDDWVRANGIPSKTATKHLEPVAQLLQWLQCLSGIRQFDTLIGTMQNMRAINPLQMRKAVREYRYEVNEGRMTEECSQYLAQLQRDWEKRRIQLKFEEAERRRSESDNSNFDSKSMSINDNNESPIDALFDGTTSLADFVPQTAPECLGELLESRYMLPFLLPQEPEFLIATPPSDTAYRNLMPMSPFITDGSATSRPPSRSSFSSSRPMGWALPRRRKLRELPPDFFKWLKERESERRMNILRNQGRLPSIDIPRNPAESRARNSSPTPTPTAKRHLNINTNNNDTSSNGLLPPLSDLESDEQTPLAIAYTPDLGGGGAAFPSPSLGSGLNTSRSLEKLRERSSMISGGSFDDMPSSAVFPDDKGGGGHIRSDSFELKLRLGGSGGYATPPPLTHVSIGVGSPNISENSFGSFTTAPPPPAHAPNSAGARSGSEGGKKKWWKLDNSRRKIREGSEDTISPGQEWENEQYGTFEMRTPGGVKTPTATTPGSGKKFWG